MREGKQAIRQFQSVMKGLVQEVRRRPPAANSIAAHLLNIRDPATGGPFALLSVEVSSPWYLYISSTALGFPPFCIWLTSLDSNTLQINTAARSAMLLCDMERAVR